MLTCLSLGLCPLKPVPPKTSLLLIRPQMLSLVVFGVFLCKPFFFNQCFLHLVCWHKLGPKLTSLSPLYEIPQTVAQVLETGWKPVLLAYMKKPNHLISFILNIHKMRDIYQKHGLNATKCYQYCSLHCVKQIIIKLINILTMTQNI